MLPCDARHNVVGCIEEPAKSCLEKGDGLTSVCNHRSLRNGSRESSISTSNVSHFDRLGTAGDGAHLLQ